MVEIGSVVSEEKIFFFISSPFFLFLAWWPSWLEVRITWHNFGRSSKEHSTKAWLQLAQWFLRKTFLCEFPIGSYVKLSSPDTFLEEIQWLFHQNLVLIQQSLVEIGSVVPEEKIFFLISSPLFSNLNNQQKFKVQSS